MIARILDEQYREIEILDAEPHCGEDFCDECSDCLYCFGGDPCYPSEGSHRRFVYSDQAAEWRAKHPDAHPRLTEGER